MRSIYMSLWLVNSLMLVISELDNAVKIQFCEYFQYFRKSCMELHNTIFRICQKCIFFIEYNGNKVFCEKIWIVLLCSNMVAHLLFTIGLFEFVVYLWNFFYGFSMAYIFLPDSNRKELVKKKLILLTSYTVEIHVWVKVEGWNFNLILFFEFHMKY